MFNPNQEILMKFRLCATVLILLFITACNSTFEVGIEHAPAETLAQPSIPTDVQAPVASIAPIETTDAQSSPVIPLPTDIPLTQAVSSSSQMVRIFMIAVDDAGQGGIPVGCGDSAVPVTVEIPPTQAVLKASLEALLSIKDQYYGQSGLYNALYQSDLQLESVSIDSSGKASVYLIGSLKMGGECDTPRVQAQLEQTVRQFPTVIKVDIFINGKPIADFLSLKG
jgi:hypothetical protein